MAISHKSKYRFEEPTTGQYLVARSDGTHGVTQKTSESVGLDTMDEAATYSSLRLHSTPHEIVRVDA